MELRMGTGIEKEESKSAALNSANVFREKRLARQEAQDTELLAVTARKKLRLCWQQLEDDARMRLFAKCAIQDAAGKYLLLHGRRTQSIHIIVWCMFCHAAATTSPGRLGLLVCLVPTYYA